MVNESNHNTGLRTKQDYSVVETALYGQPRTFWPFYSSLEAMRMSRQPESKGYNFGYSMMNGERYYIRATATIIDCETKETISVY